MVFKKRIDDDEFYTTLEDVNDIYSEYEDRFKHKTLVCPCDSEDSNFVLAARERGWPVLFAHGDYKTFLDGIDPDGKIVVTNPPFSLKDEIVRYLTDRGFEWVMILPICYIGNSSFWECNVHVGSKTYRWYKRPDGSMKDVHCHLFASFPLKLDYFEGKEPPMHMSILGIPYIKSYKDQPLDYDGPLLVPLTAVYRPVKGRKYVKPIDTKDISGKAIFKTILSVKETN